MFKITRRRFRGEAIVQKSVDMGQPIIFAAINYRLHCEYSLSHETYDISLFSIHPPALGFLGGKEVQDAGIGNLGLHDRVLHRSSRMLIDANRIHLLCQNVKVSGGFRST